MARFTRMQVLHSMEELGMVPVFYTPDADTAKHIVETCVQAGVGRIVVGPNQKIAAGADCGRRRIIVRNAPFDGKRQFVRQIHAAYVDSVGAVVVYLDPIVVLALGILYRAAVGRHKLIDSQRQVSLKLLGNKDTFAYVQIVCGMVTLRRTNEE